MMQGTNLAIDCSAGETLLPVDEAFDAIIREATLVGDCERIAVERAAGRVVAEGIRTTIPLPPFDHSAVDGYGVASADLGRSPPYRLRVTGRIAAGETSIVNVVPGQAVRVFTGALIPPNVAGVVLEERCFAENGAIVLTTSIPAGANIRRRGEDVADQSVIVETRTVLDARHVAILAAAGVRDVEVRRPVRVAVLSTGSELRTDRGPLDPGAIYDSNRPMLGALSTSPSIEVICTEHVDDEPDALASTLRWLSTKVDVILSTGGAAGSDTDHTARAIKAAGGIASSLRLALRPGKPVVLGRIGSATVFGLPGNPVAAMVNFLLFGRALLMAKAGAKVRRPRGQAALVAAGISHSRGRTEFAPARIVGFADDGRPKIEKIGRGGSARLHPLVLADGFVEISAEVGDLPPGAAVPFHAFKAAFSP